MLQSKCFSCHGPDAQKAGLRLSSRADALLGGDSGTPVIQPGKSAESPLIERVTATDPAKRMPYKRDPLSADEIAVLTKWIDAGAAWPSGANAPRPHSTFWAFQTPTHPALPEVKESGWVRNPIDAFVLAKMESEGLRPSPEADRYTLIRRVSLDLTGLLPSPEEVKAFVADTRPDASERLVDRLLASPHYGEQQAIRWLDAARYADTNGYEKDRARSIWPYRDWVINAFNKDMPFDHFVIDQLAGDMLPNPTQDDRIATGFLCNSMINEEGGVDVDEFRFEAMVDRTNTTATVFLGLTMGCAQCHSHKYDPISQREYYRFMAFLNNTDNVFLDVKSPDITAAREKAQKEIDARTAHLENAFPVDDPELVAHVLRPAQFSAEAGTDLACLKDGSLLAKGSSPDKDTYTVQFDPKPGQLSGLRLDALPDPSLNHEGPGRADNGNFVLTEFTVELQKADGRSCPVAIDRVEADQAQDEFAASNAIDGKADTGWAIDAPKGKLNAAHTATFWFKSPLAIADVDHLVVKLAQQHGGHLTLGRFRVAELHEFIPPSDVPDDVRRAQHLADKMAEWEAQVTPKAAHWTVLDPVDYHSKNHATFEKEDDLSLLMKGDIPNNDTYDVGYRCDLDGVTAIRLEVLPDPSLPGGGPGRGVILSEGDFLLSEIKLQAAPWLTPKALKPVALDHPSTDYFVAGQAIDETLDAKADTGWSIKGQEGKAHEAVWQLAQPLHQEHGTYLKLTLIQQFIHQHTIGRFRVSVTRDPLPVVTADVPAAIEAILVTPREQRTPEQLAQVKRYYLSIAPELKEEHEAIDALRASMPQYPTTLALTEREDLRKTYLHHRGQYLSPREQVTPDVPEVLPPIPEGAPHDRLTLARWLVSKANPLTSRVTMNRLWQAYFGRGIVATPGDFGVKGERPTHPKLLDWLAVEFERRGWSMKQMTRLIVTSATYRQSSNVSQELLKKDPANEWLARGPRFRVDAENIRDIALTASGLLNKEIGGPSVFPPIPDGVLNLAYDGKGWTTSEGKERYRRGLYTFWKRTLPYPAATVFDAPKRTTACVRRNRSDTPLQALTMLNDAVFVEAAQAMARRVIKEGPDDTAGRIRYAFLVCLSRPPDKDETQWVEQFYKRQLARFESGKAKPDAVTDENAGAASDNLCSQAAWTMVCRAILNLDETITKS